MKTASIEPSNETDDRELFGVLYQELKQRAHSLRRSHYSLALDTTVIVHETFLKLSESKYRSLDRKHFMHTAAMAMRQILVDHVRAMQAQKRGPEAERITLGDVDLQGRDTPEDWLNVVDALDRLREVDARLADTFLLRVFAGLSLEEIGETLGVSHTTSLRDFQAARAYLFSLLDA
ncbi:MAG: hypothetical protein JNN30_18435 [Rhodanobacteraceae bacterium]|nr:hypothetical protein [Rhodanobacteraceae bacterium]